MGLKAREGLYFLSLRTLRIQGAAKSSPLKFFCCSQQTFEILGLHLYLVKPSTFNDVSSVHRL